jgi:hypothetical protein
MTKPDSPIRGRFCDRCRGTGSLPVGDRITECPACHWVGFVGVTSEQVRQAEIDCLKEKL